MRPGSRVLANALRLATVAALSRGLVGPAAASSLRNGEELYGSACAACHGLAGKGRPASVLGFEIALPDLTDCSFATREPDLDWGAIVRHGGPVRAFDRLMPAFGEALTREEVDAVLGYVRTLCPDRSWPPGELNLPRPLVTEKAFPEDEAVITTSASAEGAGNVATRLVYERRFGARNQIEVVLPVSARERDGSGWQGGVGDVALGLKRCLAHSKRAGSIVSATAEVVLPTGAAGEGLGKGVGVFEPFLTYGQILPADSFVQLQLGAELPFDTGKAAREAFFRVAVGKSFSEHGDGRTWSPMVEILGARELIDEETTQWDLVPQMQVTLSRRQHVMLNVGVRIPLTERGPRSTQVMGYLLWDWFDGGLFEGW